jgi:membrane protein
VPIALLEPSIARQRSETRGTEARVGATVAAFFRLLARNSVTRFPWAVIQTFSKAQGGVLSGSMAYYTFLSLLPLLMVFGFIVGTLSASRPDLQVDLSNALDRVFPGGRGGEIVRQLIEGRTAFGLVGFIALAYGGSGLVGSLTACLNQMWEVKVGRNPLGQKLLNVLGVALLGLVLLGSAAATLWVTFLARTIFAAQAGLVVRAVDIAAGPALMFALLLLLYKVLPARALSWRSQIPGAIFGAVGIEIIKRAFTFWAQNSTGLSVLPRSLLAVVLLLVWLGFFGQVILYGASLNVVLDRRRRGQPLIALSPRAQ